MPKSHIVALQRFAAVVEEFVAVSAAALGTAVALDASPERVNVLTVAVLPPALLTEAVPKP